jgi:hypothetical protein
MDVYDAYWDHVRIELGYMEYVEENKSLHKALEDKDKLIADLTKLIADMKKH